MTCDQLSQIHRYHDGELSPPQRAEVEAHLAACVECRRALADLQRLSSLIAAAPMAEMPAEALQRMADAGAAAMDRGIVRIAGWLTAAAAAVIAGALLYWPGEYANGEAQATVWETVAVTSPIAAVEDTRPELLTVAQWMEDELSSGEER